MLADTSIRGTAHVVWVSPVKQRVDRQGARCGGRPIEPGSGCRLIGSGGRRWGAPGINSGRQRARCEILACRYGLHTPSAPLLLLVAMRYRVPRYRAKRQSEGLGPALPSVVFRHKMNDLLRFISS
ncbi:hypothetical protein BaRGS_00002541 [Batillaria attramentaria]|uniref:Uncharacterized protein n=1 Tax=Batillaria attramentaria TaxID=370345 RepID=A0ABD0M3N4_9CAEN